MVGSESSKAVFVDGSRKIIESPYAVDMLRHYTERRLGRWSDDVWPFVVGPMGYVAGFFGDVHLAVLPQLKSNSKTEYLNHHHPLPTAELCRS